jgi:hypothetical protein
VPSGSLVLQVTYDPSCPVCSTSTPSQ